MPLKPEDEIRLRPLLDDELFRRACCTRELLSQRFDTQLRLTDAADLAGLSPFHFLRQFQRAFGETPHDYVTRLRLEHAERLLRESEMSVTELCFELGYQSPGSFSTLFSKRVGVPPSEYRKIYAIPFNFAMRTIPMCYYMGYAVPQSKSNLVEAPEPRTRILSAPALA